MRLALSYAARSKSSSVTAIWKSSANVAFWTSSVWRKSLSCVKSLPPSHDGSTNRLENSVASLTGCSDHEEPSTKGQLIKVGVKEVLVVFDVEESRSEETLEPFVSVFELVFESVESPLGLLSFCED